LQRTSLEIEEKPHMPQDIIDINIDCLSIKLFFGTLLSEIYYC